MTEAERLEVAGLIAGLVADIAAGTINVSPAVAEWLSELCASAASGATRNDRTGSATMSGVEDVERGDNTRSSYLGC